MPRYSVQVIVVPASFYEYAIEAYRADIYRGRFLVGEHVSSSKVGAVRGAVGHTRRRRKDGAFPLFDAQVSS
jgi:hypothetical protein